jgi:hypothetical protein
MAKSIGPTVTLTVDGEAFTFTKRALEGFPEAPSFLTALLARGKVSPPNAAYYVRLVARLRRQGRLNVPQAIVHRVEKTAANAYWRWCGENYATRLRPVLDALKNDDVRFGYRWLRRGSLVPSYPGKVIQWRMLPVPPKPGESKMLPAIAEEPCSVWTLHVPRKATTPVHTDPCPDCACVKLTMEQVEVIAAAFENAWGHRNLDDVPAECFLFGTPPIDGKVEAQLTPTTRIVAIMPDGAHAQALDQIGASVSREFTAFVDRVRATNTVAVAIDFRTVKVDQIDAVMMAVREAAFRWHEAHPPTEVAPLLPLPTNNAPLPGAATTVYGDSVQEVAPEVTTEFPIAPPSIAPPPPMPSLDAFAASILGEAPIVSPLETPPAPPPVEPDTQFTDWAAISSAVKTRLVQCSVHKKPHSVTAGQVECGPNAWVEIPQ